MNARRATASRGSRADRSRQRGRAGRTTATTAERPIYDQPTRGPRFASRRAQRAVAALWLAAWVLATAVAATAVVDLGVTDRFARPAAGVLLVVFVIGLTHRCGGQLRIWCSLAVVLAAAALGLQTHGLLTSAAMLTAVAGSVLAVMATRPAESGAGAAKEFAVAFVIGVSAMIAVGAWNAQVQYQMFNLAVILLALGLSIGVVWNLGANLHGIDRRDLGILIGVAVGVIVLIAYASLVRSYGSQWLIETLNDTVVWMRTTIAGVPRPAEVFVGFPAIVLGVAMRSQRREGWWVTVFGVIGVGVMATSLVSPNAYPTYISLSTLYSALLGVPLGLLISRIVLRERGSRAARSFEKLTRTEPGRFSALT